MKFKLKRLLLGATYAALISLGPVMLIWHRSFSTFLWQQSWQCDVFYIAAIISGALAVAKNSSAWLRDSNEDNVPNVNEWQGAFLFARKYQFQIFISLFFFLYIACCALCQKLEFTLLAPGTELWKTLGLLIVLSAMAIQIPVFRIDWIIHSRYFSFLLLLLGAPLLFSVWMPLFAVPGAFIIFKWRIQIQDKRKDFLTEASGEEPVVEEGPRSKQRWRLLPYIF